MITLRVSSREDSRDWRTTDRPGSDEEAKCGEEWLKRHLF